MLVKEFGNNPYYLTNVAGTVYFTADDGTHAGLWRSDGTEAGNDPG